MPARKLIHYLDEFETKYVIIQHSLAFTSQEIAASAHVRGNLVAKTVIITVDGKMAMTVLPAPYKVDLDAVRETLSAETVSLAEESEFNRIFSDCEVGAMPPFGNLYGMEVFVDSRLTEDEEILFNAGSHRELIKMAYTDFERLVRPWILDFSLIPA